MKPLSEQDYYETLEIAADATRDDIERAYHLARSTYSEGSLAGHSVFDDGDAQVMSERIEIAYRTLRESESRLDYDAELARRVEETGPPSVANSDPVALTVSIAPPAEPIESLELEDLEELDDEEADTQFGGARLRRTRLRRGVELSEIAKITKVNPTYLKFIEEERFEDLPAAVYVRGFVMGYARCVGIDPTRVARSYMQRYDERRPSPKRSLFSRR